MSDTDPLRSAEKLNSVGFRSCGHPIYQVTPVPAVKHWKITARTVAETRYCLTCGSTIDGPQGWRGGFGVDHFINHELIDRLGLRGAFEFFIKQRPKSGTFGDVTGEPLK